MIEISYWQIALFAAIFFALLFFIYDKAYTRGNNLEKRLRYSGYRLPMTLYEQNKAILASRNFFKDKTNTKDNYEYAKDAWLEAHLNLDRKMLQPDIQIEELINATKMVYFYELVYDEAGRRMEMADRLSAKSNKSK